MFITSINLRNWRNFPEAEAQLGGVSYLLGANAMGKSNFLDAFRFLRDIVKPDGGGLQKALNVRGGISKVRCLHARQSEIKIEIVLSDDPDGKRPKWKYSLAIKSEGKGQQRPVVSGETVAPFDEDGGELPPILNRPDARDKSDPEQLTQTAIEQIQANKDFREIADHLATTTYLHLVPQLIKFGDRIGGRQLESDPFGQAFMEQIAKTPEKTRASRLSRIEKELGKVIPHFCELRFAKDETGRPHLEARYEHHRPKAGWQREDQFSDGTLRLIALFWILLDGNSLLLLEEPELSLNEEIVRRIPFLISQLERTKKKGQRQIIISTHSQALLEEKAIDARFVLRLEPAKEGTKIVAPSEDDLLLAKNGFPPAETILPKARQLNLEFLALDQ